MLKLPRLPPTSIRGPRPLPVLGSVGNLLRFFGDPVGTLRGLHARYGAVAALADRDAAMVCVFGAEHNRLVLSDANRFHNFADLLFPVPPDSAPTRLNNALTAMNGETHRRHRRLMMPAFSKASIEGYVAEMVAVTDAALARWPAGGALEMKREMVDLTMRAALRSLFGLDGEGDGENLGDLSMKYLEGLISPAAMLLPYRLPGSPYARFLALSARFEARLRALVAERRADGRGRDMLSLLLAARDDEAGGLSDAELIGQAAVMLIAGHETSAYTLCWTLFLLAQHPRVLGDLSDEVRGVLGGGAPTVEALARMALLDRVVKESQRLLPATPFMFLRRATEPFALGEHRLPAGATLILSPLVTHRDAAVFPEPQRFRPERWETLQPTPYQYLPFGAGPRLCIGAGFASQLLRVVLAMVLQRFRPALVDGARVSRKVQGITMGPRHGLPMRLAPSTAAPAKAARVRGDIGELVDLA